jgi:hypothetical protein
MPTTHDRIIKNGAAPAKDAFACLGAVCKPQSGIIPHGPIYVEENHEPFAETIV